MKKGSVFSAILGGAFFAIPYLALDVALFPSAVIAIAAYGAGNLIMNSAEENEGTIKVKSGNMSKEDIMKVVAEAKKQNAQIYAMMGKVEDKELIQNIKEIHSTVKKIIDTIEKSPEKYKLAINFFNYYLPSTLSFLIKYDEIENQNLKTEDADSFMDNAEEMMKKIKESFRIQLANLYKSDMIGTDAEMKVFDSMLKSDGIDSESDFDIK